MHLLSENQSVFPSGSGIWLITFSKTLGESLLIFFNMVSQMGIKADTVDCTCITVNSLVLQLVFRQQF